MKFLKIPVITFFLIFCLSGFGCSSIKIVTSKPAGDVKVPAGSSEKNFAGSGKSLASNKKSGEPIQYKPNEWNMFLVEKKFEEIEQKITGLLKDKRKNEKKLIDAYTEVYSNVPDPLILLNEWREHSPGSHIPFTARGSYYINSAWDARGGGWGYTVTEEGWKLFHERLKLAAADLEKAYGMTHDDPYPAIYLEVVARGLGWERDQMEKWFRNATAIDPDSYYAHSEKLVYLSPNWYGSKRQMLEFIDEVAKKNSPDSPAPFLMIRAYAELNSNASKYYMEFSDTELDKKIIVEVKKYMANHPNSEFAIDFLKKFQYIDNGAKMPNKNKYEKAQNLSNKAAMLWQEGKGDEALKLLDKAIAEAPEYSYAWYNKGYMLYMKGRNEEAVKFLNKAISLNPGHSEAWKIKTEALRKLGKEQEANNSAAEMAKAIMSSKPDSPTAWLNKGYYLSQNGKYLEAVECYDKALALAPSFKEAWNNKAFTLFQLGKPGEALKYCDKAIGIDPDFAMAWSTRGEILIALGRKKEAVDALNKSVSLARKNGDNFLIEYNLKLLETLKKK
ncbi:MAG: tetratricopeptide repeat protein [Chloroflexi bacterium]|nr:tetratricopeptide repeat protein [Chloroflexota bacterium]